MFCALISLPLRGFGSASVFLNFLSVEALLHRIMYIYSNSIVYKAHRVQFKCLTKGTKLWYSSCDCKNIFSLIRELYFQTQLRKWNHILVLWSAILWCELWANKCWLLKWIFDSSESHGCWEVGIFSCNPAYGGGWLCGGITIECCDWWDMR